jgi:hypothetical protein
MLRISEASTHATKVIFDGHALGLGQLLAAYAC